MWNFLFTALLLVPLRNVAFRYIVRLIVKGRKGSARLEVERKYFLGDCNLDNVRKRIEAENFAFWGQSEMTDWFLPTHIERELMRIRREKIGSTVANTLTVKRWVNTASGTREREESERTLGPILTVILLIIARFLQGSNLLSLRKDRSVYRGSLLGRNAIISLDDARDLGRYSGPYLEVEVMADPTEDTKEIEQSILEIGSRVTAGARLVKESYRELLDLSQR
jgi:predicted adenylyl cyclase CyaB